MITIIAMFEKQEALRFMLIFMKILKMYLKARSVSEIKTIFSHQIGQT
jgi:hypothetical protein